MHVISFFLLEILFFLSEILKLIYFFYRKLLNLGDFISKILKILVIMKTL